jgi:hypothetical protein
VRLFTSPSKPLTDLCVASTIRISGCPDDTEVCEVEVNTVPEDVKRETKRSWKVWMWALAAVASAAVLIIFGFTVKTHWNDANFVNFLVAWIPFVLSILLAFIPDTAMKMHWRVVWRSGVILGGLLYSGLLWHQQSLTADAAREDQKRLVSSAILGANSHSDQQIGSLRKDLTSQINGVQGSISTEIGSTVSKSTSELSESIGKVGKPDAPEKVKLQFSLWPFNDDLSPNMVTSVVADKDGTAAVSFAVRNSSGTAASNADIWVAICKTCEFVGEPDGFDKPAGLPDTARHRMIQLLNPSTILAKTVVHVKNSTIDAAGFAMQFRYACAGCAQEGNQVASVYVTKPQ